MLLLTGAALGDRFGRRRMFVAGLALFVAASAACALAGSVGWLIAARAVQGAGAALVMPLAMALLSVAFAREERAKALGIFSSVTGLALIAGPVVGGAIAQGVAWQWIFWINLPIGFVAIPFALRNIRESVGSGTGLDFVGLALVTAAALEVVWGLMRASSAGWADARGRRQPGRRVPARLRLRRLGAAHPRADGADAALLFACVLVGHRGKLPVLRVDVRHLVLPAAVPAGRTGPGPLGAGLQLLPWTATLFVFAPIGGVLVNRFGERPLVVLGLLLQAAGFAWIALIVTPGLGYANLVAPLIVAGAGVSLAMPAAQNAVLSAVAPSEIGKASGIFNMWRFLGGVFGVAIQVAVFATTGGVGSAGMFSAGFTTAIGLAAVLSLVAGLVGMWLPGRHAVALAAAPAKA